MYGIVGDDPFLYDWLADAANEPLIETLLEWLPRFAADPTGYRTAMKIRLGGVICMTARVEQTDIYVDYTVVEDPPTILIVGVKTQRLMLG